ncbi:MAG: diguanylate cyclase [Proteobacteria bacterium]|nr:diguanylate cyclase [Pseudomonadota bacterium]
MERVKILLVEADRVHQLAFKLFMDKDETSYDYVIAGSVKEVVEVIEGSHFDVIITDFYLGDGTALDILDIVEGTPVIVTTGIDDQQTAVEAMKKGAYDYLVRDKDYNYIKVMPVLVENAIKRKKSEDLFSLLSHAMVSICDCVYITDMEHKIIFVNNAFCETYGYRKEDIMGQDGKILCGEVEIAGGEVDSIIGDPEDGGRVEISHKRRDESTFPVLVSKSIVKNDKGESESIVRVTRDITEIKGLEDELRSLTLTDELSGIANRRKLDLFFDREWASAIRNSTEISLMMIDIDFFKLFNDTYGHQAGDECLKAVARMIDSILKRPGDIVVRYGGEEFAVVMPGTDKAGALIMGEKLRKAIEGLNVEHNSSKKGVVTISIGVSSLKPGKRDSPKELFGVADKALYRSKEEGRNMVTFLAKDE